MSEAQIDLPNGWVSAVLPDICQINPALDRCFLDESATVRFVPMAAVDEDFGGVPRWETRIYRDVKKGYTPFIGGDVILAKITPCMENGKGGVVDGDRSEVYFGSTEFHVFRPGEGIHAWWIGYYLAREQFRQAARVKMKGSAGQLRVPGDFLASLRMPLAPSKEQIRISDRIDELFTDLAAGVAALERVRRNLKRYRSAVLHAAVTGRLTAAWRAQHGPPDEPGSKLLERILAERRRQWEARTLQKYAKEGREPPKEWRERYEYPSPPITVGREALPKGWTWATVEQLTRGDRDCAYGVLKPGPDVPNGVPLIRIGDIENGRINVQELKRIAPEIAAQFKRTFLQGGELLISLVGTIGRTAIVPPEAAGANTARAVGVVPLSALLENEYVEFWFRNPTRVSEMTQKSHEVARKTLNLEDVRPTLVGLPPLAEQEVIVEALQEKLSQIEALELEVNHGLARASRLRQAILKAAFEGKLVALDPNDEPASALLARLKSQAAAASASRETSRVRSSKRSSRMSGPVANGGAANPSDALPREHTPKRARKVKKR